MGSMSVRVEACWKESSGKNGAGMGLLCEHLVLFLNIWSGDLCSRVNRSDWWGTYSTAEALNATLDLEMPGATLWRGPDRIMRALETGKLDSKVVYNAAARILALVEKVKKSGTPENAIEGEDNSERYRELNRRAAGASIVLLKNEKNLLPLVAPSKIAVIGPNATKNVSTGGGSASVNAYYFISALDGIRAGVEKVFPESEVHFAQGCYSDELLPLLQTRTVAGTIGLDIKFFSGLGDLDSDKPPKPIAEITSESSKMMFFDSVPIVALPITYAICSGSFVPSAGGEYEFGITTTGRAKLFVNDELVVDNWTQQKKSRHFFGKWSLGGSVDRRREDERGNDVSRNHDANIVQGWALPRFAQQ